MFFTVLGLYLFGGESDPVIASAIGVSNLCENEFQRLQGWTKANNEAFLSAQNLFTDWENRTKKGTELAVIFKAFSDKLNENKDWATGQSPWNKIKYTSAILEASDTVSWPDSKEFERTYPRLGIDFMGKAEATNLKAAIGLNLGDRTPSIFYHDLTLPTNAVQIPDGPWKKGDQIIHYWHNGYSFGGRRLEGETQSHLDNGPEDCSSYVSKMLGLNPDRFTTADLKGKLVEESKETTVRSLERDINPGQIVYFPGHIALSFGSTEPGKLLLLGYNRDREAKGIEGFGFQEYSIQQGQKENTWNLVDRPDKVVQFFSLAKK